MRGSGRTSLLWVGGRGGRPSGGSRVRTPAGPSPHPHFPPHPQRPRSWAQSRGGAHGRAGVPDVRCPDPQEAMLWVAPTCSLCRASGQHREAMPSWVPAAHSPMVASNQCPQNPTSPSSPSPGQACPTSPTGRSWPILGAPEPHRESCPVPIQCPGRGWDMALSPVLRGEGQAL